jgi:hypothetical protein
MEALLFFTGLLIIGASAGACDLGNIALSRAFVQSLVGLLMMAIGTRGGDEYEQ